MAPRLAGLDDMGRIVPATNGLRLAELCRRAARCRERSPAGRRPPSRRDRQSHRTDPHRPADVMTYDRPPQWSNPANKLFRYQVGFTSPPHDFDAAPTDFLRISPPTVGVHGPDGCTSPSTTTS